MGKRALITLNEEMVNIMIIDKFLRESSILLKYVGTNTENKIKEWKCGLVRWKFWNIRYDQEEYQFNGVYSRDDFPKK